MGIVRNILNGLMKVYNRWRARRRFYMSLIEQGTSGLLSTADRQKIESKCKDLDLQISDLKSVRSRVYNAAFDALLSKKSCAYQMVENLDQIQTFFSIPEGEISKTKEKLSRLKLLEDISKGTPPTISLTNLRLQKYEESFWSEPSSLLEERVISRRYEGGSQGISFRVAKGVSFRVGNHRGRLVTDKALIPVTSGDFIITNKRFIFSGGVKSFEVKLEKILSLNFADDGLIFTTNRQRPYVIRFNNTADMEVLEAFVEFVLNRCAA